MSEIIQVERLSKLNWWLVVTWNDGFVLLAGWPSVFHSSSIRHKLVSDLVSSDISYHGRVDIVCPKTTDDWPCVLAVHGEVGVFYHVSPDLTSFIRYFIQ